MGVPVSPRPLEESKALHLMSFPDRTKKAHRQPRAKRHAMNPERRASGCSVERGVGLFLHSCSSGIVTSHA
jgi:hypothetical protein